LISTTRRSCFGIQMKPGRDVLNDLKRHAKDPWWATANVVMHAGGILYETQQPHAERVAAVGHEPFLQGGAEALRLLRGAQLAPSRLVMLHGASRCYRRHCADEPARCRGDLRDSYIDCLDQYAKTPWNVQKGRAAGGLGSKSIALLKEYLGDPDAVAVDRHVLNFLCEAGRGFCMVNPKTFKRQRWTDKAVMPSKPLVRAATKVMQNLAHECGVSAAELQVAVWTQSVCTMRGGQGKKKRDPNRVMMTTTSDLVCKPRMHIERRV